MATQNILDEVTRRTNEVTGLNATQADNQANADLYQDLDNDLKAELDTIRTALEDVYDELQYMDGNSVRIYTEAEVTQYPYYGGDTDDECNPYFSIETIKSSGIRGLDPIDAPYTRTAPTIWARLTTLTTNQDTARTDFIAGATVFDNEIATSTFPGEPDYDATIHGTCSDPTYTTQAACVGGGGAWTPDGSVTWVGADTTSGKMRRLLEAWETEVQNIRNNLNVSVTTTAADTLTIDTLLTNIATVKAAYPDAVSPTHTQSPTATGVQTEWDAIKTAANTDIPNIITSRQGELETLRDDNETAFFNIIKARLHMVNGSFARYKLAQGKMDDVQNMIDDHNEQITFLPTL